jgi:hypothetical protein
MVHACREAMRMLKKTGTDFSTAKGMDPKQFFEVMGEIFRNEFTKIWYLMMASSRA